MIGFVRSLKQHSDITTLYDNIRTLLLLMLFALCFASVGFAGEYEEQMEKFAFEEAIKQYREGNVSALKIMEEYVKNHQSDASAIKELAEIYIRLDRSKDAIPLYERLIKVKPDELSAYKRLVELYSWNNISDKQVTVYEALLKLKPDDVDIRSHLAECYLWNNREKDAIIHYEYILDIKKEDLGIRRKLADLYFYNNRLKNAISQYEIILKMKPDDNETRKKIADIYYNMKIYEKSKLHYKKLLEVSSGDNLAKERIDFINSKIYTTTFTDWFYNSRSDNYRYYSYSFGYKQYLSDWLIMSASYSNKKIEQNNRNFNGGSVRFDFLNDLNDFNLSDGLIINYYSNAITDLNGYMDVEIPFDGGSSIIGASYEDVVSEALAVEEGITAVFFKSMGSYNIIQEIGVGLMARYGSYSDNNDEFDIRLEMVSHITSNPYFDMGLGFARVNFSKKDDENNKIYPYWNPQDYQTYNLVFSYTNEVKDSSLPDLGIFFPFSNFLWSPQKEIYYLLQLINSWSVSDKAFFVGVAGKFGYKISDNHRVFVNSLYQSAVSGEIDSRFNSWTIGASYGFFF